MLFVIQLLFKFQLTTLRQRDDSEQDTVTGHQKKRSRVDVAEDQMDVSTSHQNKRQRVNEGKGSNDGGEDKLARPHDNNLQVCVQCMMCCFSK